MPRPSWKRSLLKALEGASRVVVLGVGSDLRGDDGAGPRLVTRLSPGGRLVAILDGATAPENLNGQIRALKPSHIVMVDTARMGLRPGAVALIPKEEAGGVTFCTHALPVGLLAGYLEGETGAPVIIVGIQPLCTEFGAPVSRPVARAVLQVAGVLGEG